MLAVSAWGSFRGEATYWENFKCEITPVEGFTLGEVLKLKGIHSVESIGCHLSHVCILMPTLNKKKIKPDQCKQQYKKDMNFVTICQHKMD